MVYNFILVNRWTIKPGYPMYRLEEVLDTLIKPKYGVYFCTDASNGYWAVTTRVEDRNKTGFLALNGQWVYVRMGQGLKGAPYTYAQFTDLVFGPLPPNDGGIPRMKLLIGDYGTHAFSVFMDDHAAAAPSFDELFEFLHYEYFPRVVFGLVYLAGHKISVFSDNLELLGFHGIPEGLRPSLKH